MRRIVLGIVLAAFAGTFVGNAVADDTYARDPHQPVDAAYTQKIPQYTTAPEFNSPLTDYLPASDTVPTPAKVLGDVAGAPNYLPYSADVYRYFRALAAASPRVKVFSHRQDRGRPRDDRGGDRRRNPAGGSGCQQGAPGQAGRPAHASAWTTPRPTQLVAQSTPVYYITGTIHSTETGAPTALMELAYRLAVDDAPYIRQHPQHVITLITPIVEVDGRDRMVDLYNWHTRIPARTSRR